MFPEYPSTPAASAEAVGGNLPPDLAHFALVAVSPRRVGKRLFYAPADTPTDAWRPDDERAGKWVKPKDAGQKPDINVGKNFQLHLVKTATIEQRLELRRFCSTHLRAALISGLPSPNLRSSFKYGTPDHFTTGGDQFERTSQTVVDGERAWLTMDVDGLDLRKIDADVDVHADADRMPDLLRDALDDMGLDWLIADCIIQFSSTHGLHSTHHLKAHAEWRLAQPLTVAQQKLVAGYCNTQATSKGYGTPFDTDIYNPDRLLFVNCPELLKRVWVPDQGTTNVPMAHPYKGERVRHCRVGQEIVDLPDPIFASQAGKRTSFSSAATVAKAASSRPKSGVAAYLAELRDGHSHAPMVSAIASYCATTPEHRWNAAEFADLAQRIAGSIGFGINAKDSERAERFAEPWMCAEFARLREKRFVWPGMATDRQAEPRTVTVGEARRRQSERINAAVLGTEDAERPVVRVEANAPGLGKTHAIHAAMSAEWLTEHSAAVLSPTSALSTESSGRHLKQMGPRHSHLTNVVHGRSRLCINPAKNREAKQYESLGLSASKVCAACPDKDACSFLQQTQWLENGANYLQHAHACVPIKGEATKIIFDESPLGTLLSSHDKERPLADIRSPKGVAFVQKRGRRGQKAPRISETFDTADLIQHRIELRQALEQTIGPLLLTTVAKFARSAKAESEHVPYAQVARDLEDQFFWWLADKLNTLATSIAKTDNRQEKAQLKHEQRKLLREAALTKFMRKLYEAIRASASIIGRERVDAIVVREKAGSLSVSCHIRNKMPSSFSGRDLLIADGTPVPTVYKAMFGDLSPKPRLEVHRDRTAVSNYHLTLYADRAFTQSAMLGELGMCADPSDRSRRRKTAKERKGIEPKQVRGLRSDSNLKRFHRFILSLSLQQARLNRAHSCRSEAGRKIDVLIVVSLALEQLLRHLPLPNNVAIEHFNNLRGIDRYGDVPCAIVLGRDLQSIPSLEQDAAALFYDSSDVLEIKRAPLGQGVKPLEGHCDVELADGSIWQIECETHPDPHVEALRQQVCAGEVIQALHRTRLYNRTADNPLELHVFGQTPPDVPVHRVARWLDARRSELELMKEAGIVFRSAASARLAFPELFEAVGESMVEKILKIGIALNEGIYLGLFRNWKAVEFRLSARSASGRAAYKQTADVDLSQHPDPGLALRQRLGSDVSWRYAGEREWRRSEAHGPHKALQHAHAAFQAARRQSHAPELVTRRSRQKPAPATAGA